MKFGYSPQHRLFYGTTEDPGINWASTLDIIAAAAKESENREDTPFNFISDIRGINAYVHEFYKKDVKKKQRSRLFSDRMSFAYNRKDYPNSRDVSSALNSEFIRRVENSNHRPSYYQVDPKIVGELDRLAIPTRDLVIPIGAGFCNLFGCDREGKLLYR